MLKIYYAAPLFNMGEMWFNSKFVEELRVRGYAVFSPQENVIASNDATDEVKKRLHQGDVDAITDADIIVANCSGREIDQGTAAEIGIGFGKGMAVVGFTTDRRLYNSSSKINPFVQGCLYNSTLYEYPNVFDVLDKLKQNLVEKSLRPGASEMLKTNAIHTKSLAELEETSK
jgi:nucleoside 2-deoxyribosyltransferase